MTDLLTAVQVFAVIHLAVIGLSHVAAPRAWVRYFLWLRERGEAGVFVVGMMSLGFGSIPAAFHPVWTGLPLVLTLLGWAQVTKGLVYLTAPGFGLRRLERVSPERAHDFVFAGIALLVLAGVLLFHLLR